MKFAQLFKFPQGIVTTCILLSHPLGKVLDPSFKKINPLGRGYFVPGLVKLAQRFRRIRSLNFVNEFSVFRYHLPLEKGVTPHLKKI